MGCAGSKKEDAFLEGPDVRQTEVGEPTTPTSHKDIKAEVRAPEPEPEPDPPAAPKACVTFRQGDADTCPELPAGWLKSQGDCKGESRRYYYCCGQGQSSWVQPDGAGKGEGDTICSMCSVLKSDHAVCGEWKPQADGLCDCGFPKDVHTPCDQYRVDIAAENFGDCKCGFGKDLHAATAFSGGFKVPTEKRNSADVRAGFVQKEYAQCEKYRVNLNSANFGECMCGAPKAEHSPEALAGNAASGKKKAGEFKKRDSADVRAGWVQKEKVECLRFEPDLTAGAFGVCVCGAKRSDHTDAALSAGTGKQAAHHEMRDYVVCGVQKEFASCERYVVSMDPSVPFGQCACGAAKIDHSPEALAAIDSKHTTRTKRDSADVRAEMAAHAAECDEVDIEASGQKPTPSLASATRSRPPPRRRPRWRP